MKKLLVLVAILAVAAPSMAATTVSCAQVGTTDSFTISYAYTAVAPLSFPRAFALDVTTSAGTISGVTAQKTGESVVGDLGFGIFPGTIVIDTATGTVTNVGSPVAPNGDPGSITGNPITNAVTLELGSLYATGGKPADSGVLVTVALAGLATPSTTTISIVPNTTRGGVVLEDASSVGAFTSTCQIVKAPLVCKGDVNASGSVTTADLTALVGLLNTYGGKTKVIPSTNVNFSLGGDANADGSNTTGDLTKIVGWLNTYGGKTKVIACPHPYN